MTLNLFTPSSKNFTIWPQNDPEMPANDPKWPQMTSKDLDLFKCYLDLSKIPSDRKSKIPANQPTYELFGRFMKFYPRKF